MDANSSIQLDPTILGQRIRTARTHAGKTQAEIAAAIGIARTTLVAIENGSRPARPADLLGLAGVLGLSVNRLLRVEALHVDLSPQFRKLRDSDTEQVREAVALLLRLVEAEVELERILGEVKRPSMLFERPILPGDPREQAESDALELRHILGLGTGPIHDLFGVMEMDLQIRLYAAAIDSKLSGLFAWSDETGLVVLLNANHPLYRQRQSATHELGHAVGSRREPDVFDGTSTGRSREESYATAFGSAFLIPASHARRRFQRLIGSDKAFTRRHVIILAHEYGVSREALVRRFEAVGLVKDGTWDWFADNGGITDVQAAQVLGCEAVAVARTSTVAARSSVRLDSMAVRALREQLLTEGQVTELLGYDRRRVRSLVQEASEDSDGS